MKFWQIWSHCLCTTCKSIEKIFLFFAFVVVHQRRRHRLTSSSFDFKQVHCHLWSCEQISTRFQNNGGGWVGSVVWEGLVSELKGIKDGGFKITQAAFIAFATPKRSTQKCHHLASSLPHICLQRWVFLNLRHFPASFFFIFVFSEVSNKYVYY